MVNLELGSGIILLLTAKWDPNREPAAVWLANPARRPQQLVAVVAGVTGRSSGHVNRRIECDTCVRRRAWIAAGGQLHLLRRKLANCLGAARGQAQRLAVTVRVGALALAAHQPAGCRARAQLVALGPGEGADAHQVHLFGHVLNYIVGYVRP